MNNCYNYFSKDCKQHLHDIKILGTDYHHVTSSSLCFISGLSLNVVLFPLLHFDSSSFTFTSDFQDNVRLHCFLYLAETGSGISDFDWKKNRNFITYYIRTQSILRNSKTIYNKCNKPEHYSSSVGDHGLANKTQYFY